MRPYNLGINSLYYTPRATSITASHGGATWLRHPKIAHYQHKDIRLVRDKRMVHYGSFIALDGSSQAAASRIYTPFAGKCDGGVDFLQFGEEARLIGRRYIYILVLSVVDAQFCVSR